MIERLGNVLQQRRQNMGMSLSVLSRQMGGSPGASFLSRIESNQVDPSAKVAAGLADALRMPRDILLNAAGYATPEQQQEAMRRLFDYVGTPAPAVAALPVLDPENPQAPLESLPKQQRILRKKEPAALINLSGAENAPFIGECLLALAREPKDGAGVVANVGGHLRAFTYRQDGKRTWLENGLNHKHMTDYEVVGVILRVVSEVDLEEE